MSWTKYAVKIVNCRYITVWRIINIILLYFVDMKWRLCVMSFEQLFFSFVLKYLNSLSVAKKKNNDNLLFHVLYMCIGYELGCWHVDWCYGVEKICETMEKNRLVLASCQTWSKKHCFIFLTYQMTSMTSQPELVFFFIIKKNLNHILSRSNVVVSI